MIPPSGATIIEYWARPIGERGGSRHEGGGEGRRRPRAPRRTARPCATGRTGRPARARRDAPRGSPRVLDRHQPAGEVDQSGRRARSCRRGERRLVDGSESGGRRGRRSRHGARARRAVAPADAERRWPTLGGRATSARSVSNVSSSAASSKATQRTWSNSWSWRGEVAAGRLHQEVVDGLVDPGAALDEPYSIESRASVIRTSRPVSSATSRRAVCSTRLAGVRGALGQGPGHGRRVRAGGRRRRADGMPPSIADDDAAGGGGGRGPQARHGAVAALRSPGRPGDRRAASSASRRRARPAAGGRRGRRAAGSRASRRGVGRAALTLGAAQDGQRGARPAGTSRRRAGRDGARGPALEGRTNRAAGRAAYLAAMLCSMGRNGTASGRAVARDRASDASHGPPRSPVQRATRHGERDLALRQRRRTDRTTAGAWAASAARCASSVPDVAAGHRTGQGGRDPERPRVAERLLDRAAVDGQACRPRRGRPRPAQLGDRVEQGDEAAGGQDGRRVVGRPSSPGARRTGVAPTASAISASRSSELVVALDRDRRPVERGDRPLEVGEGDERVERARPASRPPSPARGPRHRAAPLVWIIAWPLYMLELARERRRSRRPGRRG